MEFIIFPVLILLGFCIIGTTGLLLFVAWYIASDIIQGTKKRKESSSKYCEWGKAVELDDYTTECSNTFYDASESGNPITDSLTFCPYCGDKIKTRQ